MRNAKREANHVGYDCFDEEGRAHRLVVSSSHRLLQRVIVRSADIDQSSTLDALPPREDARQTLIRK